MLKNGTTTRVSKEEFLSKSKSKSKTKQSGGEGKQTISTIEELSAFVNDVFAKRGKWDRTVTINGGKVGYLTDIIGTVVDAKQNESFLFKSIGKEETEDVYFSSGKPYIRFLLIEADIDPDDDDDEVESYKKMVLSKDRFRTDWEYFFEDVRK